MLSRETKTIDQVEVPVLPLTIITVPGLIVHTVRHLLQEATAHTTEAVVR